MARKKFFKEAKNASAKLQPRKRRFLEIAGIQMHLDTELILLQGIAPNVIRCVFSKPVEALTRPGLALDSLPSTPLILRETEDALHVAPTTYCEVVSVRGIFADV